MTTAWILPAYLIFLFIGLYTWALGGAVFTGMRSVGGIFQLPSDTPCWSNNSFSRSLLAATGMLATFALLCSGFRAGWTRRSCVVMRKAEHRGPGGGDLDRRRHPLLPKKGSVAEGRSRYGGPFDAASRRMALARHRAFRLSIFSLNGARNAGRVANAQKGSAEFLWTDRVVCA
jgi:hypothetical protein